MPFSSQQLRKLLDSLEINQCARGCPNHPDPPGKPEWVEIVDPRTGKSLPGRHLPPCRHTRCMYLRSKRRLVPISLEDWACKCLSLDRAAYLEPSQIPPLQRQASRQQRVAELSRRFEVCESLFHPDEAPDCAGNPCGFIMTRKPGRSPR